MMSNCIACNGRKHRFAEVLHPMYKGVSIRVYLGPCRACDGKGNVKSQVDRKQVSAGESK